MASHLRGEVERRVLEPAGVSWSTFAVLAAVVDQPGARMYVVAAATGMAHGTAWSAVSRLERLGLISRSTPNDDHRQVDLVATGPGRRTAAQLRAAVAMIETRLIRTRGPDRCCWRWPSGSARIRGRVIVRGGGLDGDPAARGRAGASGLFPQGVRPCSRGSTPVGPVDQQPHPADGGQPYLHWGVRLRTSGRCPCQARAGKPGTVSGHHPVRLLRAGHADLLPPPVASPRRLRLRPDHLPPAHQRLPIHRPRLRRCDRGRPAPVRLDAC
ncbi:MarR family winged helix-turn-helix transcriptional regulator [Dactylosporangium maewongense]|uniref:MarR family winged helix-turn-helix transcriptional regulator n=1 Tax=Dactylosporangium maewongense TaxID=634393 RepID=UPI003CD092E2